MADYKIIGNKEKLTFGNLSEGDIFIDLRDSCLYIKIAVSDFDPTNVNAIYLYNGVRVCFDDSIPVKRYARTLLLKEEDFEG